MATRAGSWSLKERRKASNCKKLVIAHGGIANAAHVRNREEEESTLYAVVAIYMVLTRVRHFSAAPFVRVALCPILLTVGLSRSVCVYRYSFHANL